MYLHDTAWACVRSGPREACRGSDFYYQNPVSRRAERRPDECRQKWCLPPAHASDGFRGQTLLAVFLSSFRIVCMRNDLTQSPTSSGLRCVPRTRDLNEATTTVCNTSIWINVRDSDRRTIFFTSRFPTSFPTSLKQPPHPTP